MGTLVQLFYPKQTNTYKHYESAIEDFEGG